MLIYESIYDLVEEKMKANDQTMPCSKEAFLFSAEMEPGVCDGQKMIDMENETFFEAAFMGMLNRLPDASAIQGWEAKLKTSSPDVFREALLSSIIFSPEAVLIGSQLRNNRVIIPRLREINILNEYIVEHDKDSAALMQVKKSEPKVGLKDKLYKIYLKLPLSLRVLVHKILRRN